MIRLISEVEQRCLKGTETQNLSGKSFSQRFWSKVCIGTIQSTEPYLRQTAARVIGLRDAFDEMEDLVTKMDRKSKLTQEPLDKQEKKDIRRKVKMVIKTIAALSSSPSVKLMDLYCSNSFLIDQGCTDNENGLVRAVLIHAKVKYRWCVQE